MGDRLGRLVGSVLSSCHPPIIPLCFTRLWSAHLPHDVLEGLGDLVELLRAESRGHDLILGAGSGGGLEKAIVSLGLEPVGKLRPALFDDASADDDVHEVGVDVTKDAGVVRDQ